jgi:cytochrome c-type biogenesis protein CcmH/NrfF
MQEKDEIIYTILLWAVPTLLAILGFIGALAVNALMSMSTDIGEIKVSVGKATEKHDALVERVERLEDKVYK